MMKNYFLLFFAFLVYAQVFSQCGQALDLNTWTEEGGNANWNVNPGGTSVNQGINGAPAFFVNDFDFINVEFTGTFRVGNSGDNDFVGFAFGYQDPLGGGADHDYYLFSTVRNEGAAHG
ncbi:hypothetical protein CW751_15020, partial [Brumimicrobium salinarum]